MLLNFELLIEIYETIKDAKQLAIFLPPKTQMCNYADFLCIKFQTAFEQSFPQGEKRSAKLILIASEREKHWIHDLPNDMFSTKEILD